MDGKYELDYLKRHQLRERIISLGVSYQQVADFLGIGKSTLQRWINGKITNCSAALTIRDRDTKDQKRIKVSEAKDVIDRLLAGTPFASL